MAPIGSKPAWLSSTKADGFFVNSCDGEGRFGDEDIVAIGPKGGVVGIIDRDGEDETNIGLAVAMVALRVMRATERSRVSFTVPASLYSKLELRSSLCTQRVLGSKIRMSI